MAIWGLFLLPGDKEICFTLSHGSKAVEVEMSTWVLIKVSTCIWICKVLGLRSNHHFGFSCSSLRPLLNHPHFTTLSLQTRASCWGKRRSCVVLLDFFSSKELCAAVSLPRWTFGCENCKVVLKHQHKTHTLPQECN